MDTKREDTDVKTAPEAPAMPAPGEPGPGPSAVPSEQGWKRRRIYTRNVYIRVLYRENTIQYASCS